NVAGLVPISDWFSNPAPHWHAVGSLRRKSRRTESWRISNGYRVELRRRAFLKGRRQNGSNGRIQGRFRCINFRAAGGYADRGTLYSSQSLEHTPTCMRSVHFEASLWTALVRSMSMHPGRNELLHIPPTQLGTEQQGTRSVHPAS